MSAGPTPLALSRVHFPVHTLGPGRRVGIWVQGCSIRCPGCISVDTWAAGRGLTSVEETLAAIAPWLAEADGVTVSGGEPFDQPAALRALLAGLRRLGDGDILVYSGHPAEALDLEAFAGLIDGLICDPFRQDLPQTRALRGSDNQRLIALTPLGERRLHPYERKVREDEAMLDVMFDDLSGEVFLAGVPRRGDLRRLAALLEAAGHALSTSEDPRPEAGAAIA